jgi:hypothetical protein
MEAVVVVLIALVMLGVGVAALLAVRRLKVLEPGAEDKTNEKKGR